MGISPAVGMDPTLSHSLTQLARLQLPPRRQRTASLTPVSHTAAQQRCHWNQFCFQSRHSTDFRRQGSRTGQPARSALEKAESPEACGVEGQARGGWGGRGSLYGGQLHLGLGHSPPPMHRAPCLSI